VAFGIAARFRPVESSPLGGVRGRRAAAILCIVLSLAGAACLGSAFYLDAKAKVGQWLLQRAWNRATASGTPVKPWPWADTHPIARLLAPAQDVDLLVLAGASGRTLAWGPGHLDDSAAPGASGNAVLSAHRDTHFGFLRDVVVGDRLIVELPGGLRRDYRVRETTIADVHALRIPRETPAPTLTLVTCYPFEALRPGGPLRYVVVAEADANAVWAGKVDQRPERLSIVEWSRRVRRA
jgi:sortase A